MASGTTGNGTLMTTAAWRCGLAIGVLAGCGCAAAQNVTFFGLVDVAVERVAQVGAERSSVSRMPGLTGSLPSRWGVRGSEDLGGGLRAVFTVEQGFTPDTGTLSQGGRAFGRQSWVGLQGPWGTVSVGRHYTMLFWSILDADLMGPNIYGSGSLDAYIPNARADNSVSWRSGAGALVVGATYSLGRDVVNAGNPAGTHCPGEDALDRLACRAWSALLKFDPPGWGAALAVDQIRGGTGAFGGLVRSELKDTRLSLNGYLKTGAWKGSLGLLRRDNGARASSPRSELWYAGVAYTALPLVNLEAQWLRLAIRGSADGATLWVARATYNLSRRSAVYATWGHIQNQGDLALSVSAGAGGSNPVAGAAQGGVAAGVRHAF